MIRLDEIVPLLERGETGRALELAESAAAAERSNPAVRLHRGMAYRAAGRYADAIAELEETERLAGADGDAALLHRAIFQRGVALSLDGDWEAALNAFVSVADTSTPGAELCAAICESLCRLGRREDALAWRQRAIRIRDQEAHCEESAVVPRQRPRPFDPAAAGSNVVAYSLFGSDPYYHECAITVARTTPASFPEFVARFYCAADLPNQVLRALRAAGAEVDIVAPRQAGRESPFAGVLWRFLAFDDARVNVVLVRDVDSPVLPRERAAIDLWLAGDAPFYGMRDNAIHAEPLLAGMWGGFTGLLPTLGPMLARFARSDHSKFVDQRFLRRVIWPRIRGATLSIDDDDALGTSVPFPAQFPRRGRAHVGMSWTRAQMPG